MEQENELIMRDLLMAYTLISAWKSEDNLLAVDLDELLDFSEMPIVYQMFIANGEDGKRVLYIHIGEELEDA